MPICHVLFSALSHAAFRSVSRASSWLMAVLLFATGCDREEVRFEPNLVYYRVQKLAEDVDAFQAQPVRNRIDDIERVLAFFCGTPDEPRLPSIERLDVSPILDLEMLQIAAGAGTGAQPGDATGLYRKMCASCHGVAGSGAGPQAARLNPYPRDYRRGIFKFKRTPSTLPPTDADLHNIVVRGVPGTAMPSFRALRGRTRSSGAVCALSGHSRQVGTRFDRASGL